MPRPARPSDVYRLPEQSRQQPAAERPPEPPRRRFPAWVAVAGVLAAALIISGLVRGATEAAAPGDVPLVDVISEDQAIAALRLYGAQASTINTLRERTDIYASPGPRAAAQVGARGAGEVQKALDAARRMNNADPLFSAYVNSGDHPTIARFLATNSELAQQIALLAAAHDTLYTGSGAIPINEAYTRLSGLVSNGSTPSPLHRWGTALLEQIEDRNRVQEASEARAAAQQLWARDVESLEPAAVAELQTYVNGLPAVTVQGLRGHPVAGPALQLLDQQAGEAITGQ